MSSASPIRIAHGRRGQETEYYAYSLRTPHVVVQRHGTRWLLALTCIDTSWRVLAYYDTLADAQCVAQTLIERYAQTPRASVSADAQLALQTLAQMARRNIVQDVVQLAVSPTAGTPLPAPTPPPVMDLHMLLYGTPTFAQVQAFFRHGTFHEDTSLVQVIRRWLLRAPDQEILALHNLDIADILHGRYTDAMFQDVLGIFAWWNALLGFHYFGPTRYPDPVEEVTHEPTHD